MIKVEFQVRGSLYIHSFLWIADAPVLTKETIELHKQSADGLISAKLPDHNQDPELYKLVKTYQLHLQSKTCRKFQNNACRFCFGSNKFISSLRINYWLYNPSNCFMRKNCLLDAAVKLERSTIKISLFTMLIEQHLMNMVPGILVVVFLKIL